MGLSHSPKVISDGLVLYLDATNTRSYSGTGSTWTDLSGYGYNSTLVSSPTYINNKYGQLAFNGSTQYATVPYTSTLWNGQTFTLSVWAKKIGTGDQGTRGIMISKNINYIDHAFNGKTMASFRNNSGGQYLIYGNDPASYNEWRHYAVTYDGTMGILYENGAATGSTTLAMVVNSTSADLHIGRWDGGSHYFNGCISGAMVYNRALSADEVLQNYNATKYKYILKENIVTSGLSLYHDFSDYRSAPFTGVVINDVSGGLGLTSQLFNGAAYSSDGGGSIVLDGTNDYVLLPTNFFNHNSGSPFSVSVWFKTTASTGIIFGQVASGYVPAIYITTSGQVATSCFWGGSTSNVSATGTSVNTGSWQNCTVTFAGTTHKSYLNGVLYGTIVKTQVTYSASYTYYLGNGSQSSWAGAGSNTFFAGSIGMFIFYTKTLTDEEVLQNYNATKTRFGIS
jgi:hypothetical protein